MSAGVGGRAPPSRPPDARPPRPRSRRTLTSRTITRTCNATARRCCCLVGITSFFFFFLFSFWGVACPRRAFTRLSGGTDPLLRQQVSELLQVGPRDGVVGLEAQGFQVAGLGLEELAVDVQHGAQVHVRSRLLGENENPDMTSFREGFLWQWAFSQAFTQRGSLISFF